MRLPAPQLSLSSIVSVQPQHRPWTLSWSVTSTPAAVSVSLEPPKSVSPLGQMPGATVHEPFLANMPPQQLIEPGAVLAQAHPQVLPHQPVDVGGQGPCLPAQQWQAETSRHGYEA